MEVLFKPAEGARLGASAKRRSSETSVSGDSDDSMALVVGESPEMEGIFSGALELQRRWQREGQSKALLCMLWCTIALGAMTSNLHSSMVRASMTLVGMVGMVVRGGRGWGCTHVQRLNACRIQTDI